MVRWQVWVSRGNRARSMGQATVRETCKVVVESGEHIQCSIYSNAVEDIAIWKYSHV